MHVIDLFLRLLSAESVTPNDGGLMEFIERYLGGYDAIYVNEEGVTNLFLTKEFGEGDHLCFAGHVDVVPPGDGWKSNPFEPLVDDGTICARGAQDMKSGVAAFMQACKQAEKFQGRLSILLTSDEEGDALYGTQIMLKHLKTIDRLPDYVVVAEPTCEEQFGDAIKIGRRGSINGKIEKLGLQGHAAYPEKATNPIHKVAKVLPHMAGAKLDDGDEFFSPSQFVVTDIRSGMEVTNVTPGRLSMMFNVRNSTKTNKEDIEDFVHRYFSEMDYTLTLAQSAKPFMTNPESKIVHAIDASIQKVCGITPKHSTAGGTSDARFFAEYGVAVVEFGVINDTIHAPNERTTIDEVTALYEVFCDLVERF